MNKKYLIYNKDKNENYPVSFEQLRILAISSILQHEAINSDLTPSKIFNYGIFVANIENFIKKLYSSDELLDFNNNKNLETELKLLNDLRSTNLTVEEYREFFNDITNNFIQFDDSIIQINKKEEFNIQTINALEINSQKEE